MGWNIDHEEKLVISDDENHARALKHLLDAMGKEDAGRPNRNSAKFKNKYVGDVSNEDDDGLSEDESDQEEVQGIYNSHIDDSTKYRYRLSQIRLVLFLIKRDEEGGLKKNCCVLEESFRTEITKMGSRENEGTVAIKNYIRECLVRASESYQPIKLVGKKCILPKIFVSFLLSFSDTKGGIFKRAYGGHQLALLDLLGQCEAILSPAYNKKMKRLY
jgi:hypothetical protein